MGQFDFHGAKLWDIHRCCYSGRRMGKEMKQERLKQTVKHGTWLYDDTALSEVWIIKQNYFDGPASDDEEKTPDYPPVNEKGEFFYVAYGRGGQVMGISNVVSSASEAIQIAESTLKKPIQWDSN